MVKETHTKGGYLFGLLTLPFISDKYLSNYEPVYRFILLVIYIYFTYIGSLAPDIDMRSSCASKSLPKLYKLFGSRFRHRSFTHSILFLYLLYNLSSIILKYTDNNIVFICSFSGFIIGCLSHMTLDLFTKEGVELLYPIDINFSLMPIKTNSKTEKLICKILEFTVIFLLGYRFYTLI
ncbi:MAG: metal-dependent hydrolase [Romboutsia sp.]|nr:metal-dependent hydrolase [Romboutsia sp.]